MKQTMRRRKRYQRCCMFEPRRCRQERILKRVVLWWLLPLLTDY